MNFLCHWPKTSDLQSNWPAQSKKLFARRRNVSERIKLDERERMKKVINDLKPEFACARAHTQTHTH